jgi:hypothetical protein
MKVKIKCTISIRTTSKNKSEIKIKDKRIVNGIEKSLVPAISLSSHTLFYRGVS